MVIKLLLKETAAYLSVNTSTLYLIGALASVLLSVFFWRALFRQHLPWQQLCSFILLTQRCSAMYFWLQLKTRITTNCWKQKTIINDINMTALKSFICCKNMGLECIYYLIKRSKTNCKPYSSACMNHFNELSAICNWKK